MKFNGSSLLCIVFSVLLLAVPTSKAHRRGATNAVNAVVDETESEVKASRFLLAEKFLRVERNGKQDNNTSIKKKEARNEKKKQDKNNKCKADCSALKRERRGCLSGCKTVADDGERRMACNRECTPKLNAIRRCYDSCENGNDEKKNKKKGRLSCDDSPGDYDSFGKISCAITSAFAGDECEETGISGMWPIGDGSSNICEISNSFNTKCRTDDRKRRASLDAAGYLKGPCDEISSAEEKPVSMRIRTNLPDWNMDIRVDFATGEETTTPSCKIKVDGVPCNTCAICQTYGEVGIRAWCDSMTGSAAAFASDGCISAARLAGGGP